MLNTRGAKIEVPKAVLSCTSCSAKQPWLVEARSACNDPECDEECIFSGSAAKLRPI